MKSVLHNDRRARCAPTQTIAFEEDHCRSIDLFTKLSTAALPPRACARRLVIIGGTPSSSASRSSASRTSTSTRCAQRPQPCRHHAHGQSAPPPNHRPLANVSHERIFRYLPRTARTSARPLPCIAPAPPLVTALGAFFCCVYIFCDRNVRTRREILE
jgi:hypothetical protein